jgi:protein-disulfide isomerase
VSLKKLAAAAVITAGLVLSGPASAELSKAEVEKIVEDYIMNHADVILKAVDNYQRKDMQRQQEEALSVNREQLFSDEKSPFVGNPKGEVTLIEFFDYNCHYCKVIFPEVLALTESDKNLKVIFKDLPILGATSETTAKWALAAHLQGKYFEMHQKLMEHKGPFKDEDIEQYAKDAGLDMDKAKRDVEGTEVLLQIERNRTLAQQMNFRGTPAFVINDKVLAGADKKELRRRIEEAHKAIGGADKKAE